MKISPRNRALLSHVARKALMLFSFFVLPLPAVANTEQDVFLLATGLVLGENMSSMASSAPAESIVSPFPKSNIAKGQTETKIRSTGSCVWRITTETRDAQYKIIRSVENTYDFKLVGRLKSNYDPQSGRRGESVTLQGEDKFICTSITPSIVLNKDGCSNSIRLSVSEDADFAAFEAAFDRVYSLCRK